jgi:hypothetical protein
VVALLQARGLAETQASAVIDLLLWYGVLGVLRADGEATYIYHTYYDFRKLRTLLNKQRAQTFQINPAFWAGLEIKDRV